MPDAKSQKITEKLDRLMERASQALVGTDYFAAERAAREALELAHANALYERMSRIIMPLQEARRAKRLAAVDTGRLLGIDEKPAEMPAIEQGVYLIEPPFVGADGRDLRERADAEQIPVLVVVREPMTQLGRWPIVMIGPITVRARVPPPEHEHDPGIPWCIAASEALGDEAIASVDPEAPLVNRVNALMDRLGTCPEHEKLHQALEEACRLAAREQAAQHASA